MRTTSILAAWGAIVAVLVAGPAPAESISLTFQPLKSPVVTPKAARSAVGLQSMRYEFNCSPTSGSIQVAGTELAVRVQKSGSSYGVGVDSDGDGSVSSGEYRRVSVSRDRAKPIAYKVKAGGKEAAVILADLNCGTRSKSAYAFGNALPGGCMKGAYGGVMIRLIDDNLDGEFTQDGKDAVAMGLSAPAVPLLTHHLVGRKHCRLKVSGDGDRLEITPLEDVRVGQVRLPMRSSIAKCVILASPEAAYDVAAAGAAGIPAGEYKLAYGIVGDARSPLMMVPGKDALTYTIEAGKINTPRMGKPFRLDFKPSSAGDTVRISPQGLRVVGAGGEVYSPIQFDRGGNASTPKLRVLSGSRVLAQDSMKYG